MITPRQNGDERFYPITDPLTGEEKWYVSVTTVLQAVNKTRLNEWRVDKGREESDRIKEDTGLVGTRVHQYISRLIQGETISDDDWWDILDERERNSIRAYERWRLQESFHPEDTELTVWSHAFGYAGTIDTVGHIRRRRVVVDFKTGGIWPTARLQVAALVGAYLYTFPRRTVHEARVVHLDRGTGEPSQVIITQAECHSLQSVFLATKHLWEYLHKVEEETK